MKVEEDEEWEGDELRLVNTYGMILVNTCKISLAYSYQMTTMKKHKTCKEMLSGLVGEEGTTLTALGRPGQHHWDHFYRHHNRHYGDTNVPKR